jgi:DNA-binding MarR family transcriptional regulator
MNDNCDRQDLSDTTTQNVLIAIRKIIQSIDLNSKSLIKRVGLTGPQLTILHEVINKGEVSVGEIAEAISLSQGTVTGILERMANRGLVIRRRSEIDKRRVLVKGTDAGKQLLKTAPPLLQEVFLERFNGLQDWEKTMILSSLQRLASLMDTKAIQTASILATGPITEFANKMLKEES